MPFFGRGDLAGREWRAIRSFPSIDRPVRPGRSGRMRHVLSALVQNQPGVLAHVSGMLGSRGFNIDSLAVGETEDPQLSRMTFVVHGDDGVLERSEEHTSELQSPCNLVCR